MSFDKPEDIQKLIEYAEEKLFEVNKSLHQNLFSKVYLLSQTLIHCNHNKYKNLIVKCSKYIENLNDINSYPYTSKRIKNLEYDVLLSIFLEIEGEIRRFSELPLNEMGFNDSGMEPINSLKTERLKILKELEALNSLNTSNSSNNSETFTDRFDEDYFLKISAELLYFYRILFWLALFVFLAVAAVLVALYLPEHMPSAIAVIVEHLIPLAHDLILGFAYCIGGLSILAMFYAGLSLYHLEPLSFSDNKNITNCDNDDTQQMSYKTNRLRMNF